MYIPATGYANCIGGVFRLKSSPMLTATPPGFVDFSSLQSVQVLREHRDASTVGAALHELLGHCPRLPLPGRGDTLERWRSLQGVAALDLTLAKLAEPHWDALAILEDCVVGGPALVMQAFDAAQKPHGQGAEAAASDPASLARLAPTEMAHASLAAIWAVWAAEPPSARLDGVSEASSSPHLQHTVRLNGRKAWCSGAGLVSHALVTYWNEAGESCLAAVDMRGEGVTCTTEGWHAVGMDASASHDVLFDNAFAIPVGQPGAYLQRPGFWHGGMGIAACWSGGALALGQRVAEGLRTKRDPHGLAHLGAIDVALSELTALIRATALWVDLFPNADAQWQATRLRAAAERCATSVLDHAGRAMGAAPLCREPAVARLFADLPVFIRQFHAERDLAALGEVIASADRTSGEGGAWVL